MIKLQRKWKENKLHETVEYNNKKTNAFKMDVYVSINNGVTKTKPRLVT